MELLLVAMTKFRDVGKRISNKRLNLEEVVDSFVVALDF